MFRITARDLTSTEASRVDGSCSRIIVEVVVLGDSGTWCFVRYSFEHPCGLVGDVLGKFHGGGLGILGDSEEGGKGTWRITV